MNVEMRQWLQKFFDFATNPTPQSYQAIFHPDGHFYDPVYDEPIPARVAGQAMANSLQMLKDLRITPLRWRSNDNLIYLECRNGAVYQDDFVQWEAVYRVELEGAGVIRGRRFYNVAELALAVSEHVPSELNFKPLQCALDWGNGETSNELLEPLDPSAFVDEYKRLWNPPKPSAFAEVYASNGLLRNPGFDRWVAKHEVSQYYQWVSALAPNIEAEFQRWAGDSERIYIEWVYHGTIGSQVFELPVVDSFEMVGKKVQTGKAFFDQTRLAALLNPDVKAFRASMAKAYTDLICS